MPKVYAFAANGTEETELLAVVDILRRAKIDTVITSVDGEVVTGSRGVKFHADACIKDCDFSDADMLVLPGGMPGAVHLADCETLSEAVTRQLARGKRVAAICAAPALCLAEKGHLRGRKAICNPDFEQYMDGVELVRGVRFVTDGNITTAPGMGCSLDFGLELVRVLCGAEVVAAVKKKMVIEINS